jgi:hypothetical protein
MLLDKTQSEASHVPKHTVKEYRDHAGRAVHVFNLRTIQWRMVSFMLGLSLSLGKESCLSSFVAHFCQASPWIAPKIGNNHNYNLLFIYSHIAAENLSLTL